MASGKLDPMARARDFVFTPRTRVKPISTARKTQQTERIAREAMTIASTSGGGGSSSIPIFDSLPDATPEDVGSIIYVAGASGQPARGYMGVQTQNDTVIWEPVFTQAFYGAATEVSDEFYSDAAWLFVGATLSNGQGGIGHPGVIRISTTNVSGNRSSLVSPLSLRMFDINKTAFIVKSESTSTRITRIGAANAVTAITDGVYLEKLSADTNWFLCKSIGGVTTRVNSGVAANTTDWFLFQIEDTGTSGEFKLTVTNLTAGTVASTVVTGMDETDSVLIFFMVETASAASRFLDIDYWWIRHHETVRA